MGESFIEVMVAAAVLCIVVLGAAGYRWHTALDARKADLHTNAARTALLLSESWAGVSDPNTFDPLAAFASVLTIEPILKEGPPPAPGFTMLGRYRINIEGVQYKARLTYNEMPPDLSARIVNVRWNRSGSGKTTNGYKLSRYVTD